MGSQPALWQKPWPSKKQLSDLLREQLPRVLQLIGSVDDNQLDSAAPFAHPGDSRTLGHSILHGLHDEANHQGEMYLLLKMQRLGG